MESNGTRRGPAAPDSGILPAACGLSAAMIGVLALAGWLTGLRELAEVRPNLIPMAPNTAIGFLTLGVVLCCWRGGGRSRWRRALGLGGSVLVLGLSLLRLLEYIRGVDLDVDAWFYRVPAGRLGLAPVGKMALFTALAFLTSALAALVGFRADRDRPGHDVMGIGGLAAASAGAIFGLGYLYSAPLLYGSRMIPMALNTAVGFLLIGTGEVLAAGPTALPLRLLFGPSVSGRLLRAFLPFALLAVVASSWLTLLALRLTAPAAAAIVTALAVAVAVTVAGLLCAMIAGRIGDRLGQAEAALRRANDELEQRVDERTRELRQAKAQLEERNRLLQESTDELRRTADSVRRAHQELQQAHDELKRAEMQLIQSEKLASLGQVAAGVAHEINNPLAYVTNNVVVLQRDVGHLQELIRLYQHAEGAVEEHQRELLGRIHDLAEQVDLTYVLDNVPSLLTRSHEGLRRIQRIVRDLCDFVRLDEAEFKEVDLNDDILATLRIVRGVFEQRGVALEHDLEPLPRVTGYPAKISQVVLNLITNALDATGPGGLVTVRSRPAPSGGVLISVADTGRGIDPAIREKIFDPFFTTKPVGQGTGLGLALSYGIVRAHGGAIAFESEVGRGSLFTVRLPSRPKPADGTSPPASGLAASLASGLSGAGGPGRDGN